MTLEDFFTLTEMKDGLTSPARVEELIAVMKKEKDCLVKNVGDATRQWSAVSSTIAATDNKDCLDLFIQLDGLWFINIWLKDAQKLDTDTSEGFVEEAITAMLGALEKLHIDNDRSTSSGIWITVKNLINHSSLRIRDRARALCNRWKQDGSGTDNMIHQAIEGSHDGVVEPESSAFDIPLPKEGAKVENCSVGPPMRDEVLPSKSSGGLLTENIENSQVHAHDSYPNSTIGDKGPLPGVVSVESSMLAPEQPSDLRNLTDSTKDASNSSDQSGVREFTAGSSIVEPRVFQAGIDVASVQESVGEPALQSNLGVNKVEGAILKSEAESGVDDMVVPGCSNTWSKNTSQKTENGTFLQESSGKEHTLANSMEDSELPLTKEGSPCVDTEPLDILIEKRKEDTGSAFEERQHLSDADEDSRSSPKFSESVKDARRPNIEHVYGVVDALKVAQEVGREVLGCREPSCSPSSEKAADGGVIQPCGSDSTNGKEDQTVSGPSEEMPAKQNVSPEECAQGGEHVMKSDLVDAEPENCLPDMESSQVTEAAQEPEANSERGGMCGFDLNQEICSDDMGRAADSISTTISVVSASRPTVSPGLPVAPLQFEGTLGWKGSALTSAFRPASPRRTSDGGGSSSGSKCRQGHLDFDLNVAEDGEDKFADQTSGKQMHASFGLPSGESSVETSSKKPERVKLDLNCVGDAPSAADMRVEGLFFLHQNGHRSPSPASSSSSMQPSMRNIDLNDRPHIQNDSSQQGSYHTNFWQNVNNAYGGTRPDDPVISIMGTRVEVKRKDFVPQTLSLSNGKAPEFAMDANVARTAAFLGMGPAVPYTHPPAFGYNGFTAGPTMSYSSAMYGAGGPVPYMIDSRGTPVAPQVVGSGSAIPPYTQQPFIMRMTSAPSRPNFDLNSGFVSDGGNREASSLRQFLTPGQGRTMDEHLRANSSCVKRKEPDSGWEPFSFNYKHQQPPWK